MIPNVKRNIKAFNIQPVFNVLPEDKRKAVIETIEFGKGWQAMHEELGID